MFLHSISSVPTCTSSNADHLINRLYIRTSVFVSFETVQYSTARMIDKRDVGILLECFLYVLIEQEGFC